MPPTPKRGEVWVADLDPVRGHEQAGRRPVLIVSVDSFNAGPAQLVYVVPLTRTDRGVPLHVAIAPPEGGLRAPSVILCDADSRPYVNDRAAWVVSLLDDAKEHGHTISAPRGVMPSEWYATGGWSYEALAPSDSESQEQSLALTEPPAEEVQQPEEDVSAPVQPEELTGYLRSELLVRVRDRALRSLIETLSVSEGPQAITVACAREHLSLISGPLYSHIHAILHSCGRALPIRLRAAQQPLASPASAAVDDPGCPDWIAAERWQGLSPMLRAALRGSRLEDGALRCVTPYLDQVVATRYRADVADLVCSSPRA